MIGDETKSDVAMCSEIEETPVAVGDEDTVAVERLSHLNKSLCSKKPLRLRPKICFVEDDVIAFRPMVQVAAR
jgi:hypothetical protein